MELLIKNAKLVDETGEKSGDVLVRDGKIAAVGFDLPCAGEVIDAAGLTLLPAFVDLHVHFRDPGLTHKEDIETGSRAAARGGYTAVNLMANTNPVCSHMDTVRYVLEKARKVGLVDVHQCVSVTENFDGKTIDHLHELDGSVRMISEDGKGVMSNHVMTQAMKIAKEKGWTVLSHAEDMEISPYDYRLAENIQTVQHIAIAKHVGCKLHMCHVSTAEAMDEVVRAKVEDGENARITCEVGPHHLYFSDFDYRVNPPIRKKEDVDFLIWCCLHDYVDAIATDHAPHTAEDKKNGSPGMVGLETAFGVCYTILVRDNGLPLEKLSRMMSASPAKIMGLNKGRIQPGYDGDFALVDTERVWVVDEKEFASKGKNSPFIGKELQGKVVRTIKGGVTTWKE